MIKSFSFCLLICLSLCAATQDLTVMTFNIRYKNNIDSLNGWSYRKDKVASQILFHKAHIVGVQEAMHEQMIDMQQRLPAYKSIGVGRDGKQEGEYSAIWYDTTRLQLLAGETFWLSETPDVPASKGWDAALTRVATWAKFRDRKTKKIFFAFNTHFDHKGKEARKESAKLLLQKIKEIAGTTPSITTGDFNSRPSEEPIQVILDSSNPLHLTDTKEISATPHYGPTGTFNGFGPKETEEVPIDFIFTKGKWKVLTHATLSESWGGRYSSDHFAVLAEVRL